MTDWPLVKLGALGQFKNGLNYSKENWGTGAKVIGVGDFKDYLFPKYDELDEINPKGVIRDVDYLEDNDILFVRSNGNRELIGRSLFIRNLREPISHSGFTIRLRFQSDRVYVPFYVYLFRTSLIRNTLSLSGGSTNINNLNQGILQRLEVPVPPIEVQKKVAAVLAAYDDLIENNKRRIAILEKMAEEIYREWFVRMRFPGHENTKLEKGVPNGWYIRRFEEFVSYYVGGGWGEEAQTTTNSDGSFVIRGTDIPKLNSGNFVQDVFRFHKQSNLKSRRLKLDDFVFEVSGGSTNQLLGRNLHITDGLIKYFDNNVMCASFCKLLRFDKQLVSPYFIRYFLKLYYDCDLVGIFQVQSTGISNYQFESFLKYQTVILPPQELRVAFENVVKPMIQAKDSLSLCNLALTKSRDLLLPRLISGKLSVEDLDIQSPPSMIETEGPEQETAHA